MSQDLIKRLEAATGGDRELDAEIAATLRIGDNLPDWAKGWNGEWKPTTHGRVVLMENSGNLGPSFNSPSFTSSIDCAVELAERVLPEHTGGYQPGIDNKFWAAVYYVAPNEVQTVSKAVATTPALALCIAILKAKEAQDAQ